MNNFKTIDDIKKNITNFDVNFWTDLEFPLSVNASIKFDGGIKSSKLIRNLMDLCYNFGVGLTSPMLSQDNENMMIFGLKQNIPSIQYAKKYFHHLEKCVHTIENYLKTVGKQMDFVTLDVSMFSEFDVINLNFDSMVNQRDNKYNGSWNNFKIDLTNHGFHSESLIIDKCVEFENKNKTDMGIVGKQIIDLLGMTKVGLFDHIAKS